MNETYVTFSDKPVGAIERNTVVLAGNTDAEIPLKELLIQMYAVWLKSTEHTRQIISP